MSIPRKEKFHSSSTDLCDHLRIWHNPARDNGYVPRNSSDQGRVEDSLCGQQSNSIGRCEGGRRQICYELVTPRSRRIRHWQEWFQRSLRMSFNPLMTTYCVGYIDMFTQADLNSDGRADYLWVDPDDGAVIAYLNTGHGNEISWKAVNDGKPMAYGVGKGAGVHFANMGGQKQVDYLLVDHDNVSPISIFSFILSIYLKSSY